MIIKCSRKNCENKFDKIVPHQKYCSPTCKQIAWAARQIKNKRTFKIANLALILVILFQIPLFGESASNALLDGKNAYFQRLVNSIYLAEGGKNTKFPYGIKSVKCDGEKDCRQVCLNTVQNNYKRWLASDQKKTYLEFLRDRYAPLSDSQLNNNWLKNVKYLMEKI